MFTSLESSPLLHRAAVTVHVHSRSNARLDAAVPTVRLLAVTRRRVDDTGGRDAESSIGAVVPATIAGYRVVRRLGAGRRIDAYLARRDDETDDVPVAVRVYRAGDDEATALELEALDRVDGRAWPRLIDLSSLRDGRLCVVQELFGGPSLASILSRRRLSAGEAVTISASLVQAVAALHAVGFSYGPMRTSEVQFSSDGRPAFVGAGAVARHTLPDGSSDLGAIRADHEHLAELLDGVWAGIESAPSVALPADWLRERIITRPFVACLPELERVVFAIAPPAAVDLSPVTQPEPVPVTRRSTRSAVASTPAGRVRSIVPDDLLETIAALIETSWVAALRTRLGRLMVARRPAVIVGGCLAAATSVLLLTLVPPSSPAVDAAGSAPSPHPTAVEPSVSSQGASDAAVRGVHDTGDEADEAIQTDDAVDALRSLLERRAECWTDLSVSCLEAIEQPGSAILDSDRRAIIAAHNGEEIDDLPRSWEAEISVAGAMGEAVLLRIDALPDNSEPASALIVRGEAGWRLREIFAE